MVQGAGINWRKWRSLSVLAGLSLFMVTQYQNCVPSEDAQAQQEANAGSVTGEESSPVSVINDVKSGAALSFSLKQVEIHSSAPEAVLEGNCAFEQEGAVLGWKVHDEESNQEFERGYAKCESGHFQVEVASAQDLECEHAYKITARLGYGQAGELKITRRCQPEAVADGSQFKAELQTDASSSCVLERHSEYGTGCSVVCYSQEGLVQSEKNLEPTQCEM